MLCLFFEEKPMFGTCRVPEECPKVIFDLCVACTSNSPRRRPTAKQAMDVIEESLLVIPGTGVAAPLVAAPFADDSAANGGAM